MTDRTSILAACEDRAGDRTQLLVAADFFAEAGDLKWETVLRWMVANDKYPHWLPHSPDMPILNPYMWTCFGGLCGPKFNCGVNHTLPRALCRRLSFWEWRCYSTWTEAVEALAEGLAEGPVECVGDPLQAEVEAHQ